MKSLQVQRGYICLPNLCLHYVELNNKDNKHRPPHDGLHLPYAAVCLLRRQAGRPDDGNRLESGEIRGNMLTRQFAFGPPLYRTNGEKL